MRPTKTSTAVSLLLCLSATASRSRRRARVLASFRFRRYEVSMDRVCLESASKRAYSLWHRVYTGCCNRLRLHALPNTARAPHIISQKTEQANTLNTKQWPWVLNTPMVPNSQFISVWTQQQKNEAIDRAKKRKDDRRLLRILIFMFVAGKIR